MLVRNMRPLSADNTACFNSTLLSKPSLKIFQQRLSTGSETNYNRSFAFRSPPISVKKTSDEVPDKIRSQIRHANIDRFSRPETERLQPLTESFRTDLDKNSITILC